MRARGAGGGCHVGSKFLVRVLAIRGDRLRSSNTRRVTHTIRAGQDGGSIRNDLDPEAAAWWIMGMARGIAAFTLNQPEVAASREVRRLCGESIVTMLTPRTAADGA